MVDLAKLRLRVFIGILLVHVLIQLKSVFSWCNQFGFYGSLLEVIFIIGLLATAIGYLTRQFFGWIAGIMVFLLPLFHFYSFIILQFVTLATLSPPSLILTFIMNLPSIFLTTFVYAIFIIYVISTKNYFKQPFPEETTFHKVMFVFLLFAFIGSLFIVYQNSQMTVCPAL